MTEISRRDFLKMALLATGLAIVPKIPDWIDNIEKPQFEELVKICTEVLSEDEVLDILDQEDLNTALGLVFTFLLSNAIDPDDYLIMKDFLV